MGARCGREPVGYTEQVIGQRFGLVYNAVYKIGNFLDIPLHQQENNCVRECSWSLGVDKQVFRKFLKDRGATGAIVLMSSIARELGTFYFSTNAATQGLEYRLLLTVNCHILGFIDVCLTALPVP